MGTGRNSRQDEQDEQDAGMEDQELQKALAKSKRPGNDPYSGSIFVIAYRYDR